MESEHKAPQTLEDVKKVQEKVSRLILTTLKEIGMSESNAELLANFSTDMAFVKIGLKSLEIPDEIISEFINEEYALFMQINPPLLEEVTLLSKNPAALDHLKKAQDNPEQLLASLNNEPEGKVKVPGPTTLQ